MSWSDVSRHVAFAAEDRMVKASQNTTSLGEFYGNFVRSIFVPDASAPPTDTVWLARVIWEDRESFFALCLRGHLPGCALLLVVVLEFLPESSEQEDGMLYLQDLASRLYLVGSRRDQQILEHVCLSAINKKLWWSNSRSCFASAEDSRTLAQAYSGLLCVWQQDKSSTKPVPIRLMTFLTAFVLQMSGLNPLATPPVQIDVVSASFSFLWLYFEQRGQIPVNDHSEVRQLAMAVFSGLKFIVDTCISTRAERRRLGKMLTDAEVIGLAGRVVLLLADEGIKLQSAKSIDQDLEELSDLKFIIDATISVAADLFRDMRVEWVAVVNHLASLAGSGTLNRRDKDSASTRCWLGMCDTWIQFGNSLGNGNGDDAPHSCAYPRCWRPPTQWKNVKIDYKCGRCSMVSYCGPDCQRA
ncbi:hypothetical protein FS749_010147 [Ceratobasidium sp. UAMH 11750]|nr:hypothetical protein FS749_010147 [Ceratobasidium sp. UAMH 11750]